MTTPHEMEEFWSKRGRALIFVALVGMVYSMNYTNHGPLKGTLVKEFGLTFAMVGFLSTAIFTTHALLQVPGGALADKFGAKNVATFGLSIITICNLAAGLAVNFP